MTVVLAAAAAVVLGVVFALGVLRPLMAVGILLALLPVHSLAVILTREWFGSTPALTLLGLWKEAAVAGLVLPIAVDLALALTRVRRMPRPALSASAEAVREFVRDPGMTASTWLTLAFIAYVSILVPLSLVRGNAPAAVALDWRGLAVPMLAFVAVRARGISLVAALPAVRVVVAVAIAIAVYAYVQVFVLGFRFLNTFYRDPGEPLATAYKVGVSAVKVPRAVGGSIAPNEFALLLVIALVGYLVVLLRRPASTPTRWLQLIGGYLILIALLLTYSRSGWVAAVVGIVTLIVAWVRLPGTWLWLRRRSRDVLVWGVTTLAVLVFVAWASGVFQVASATVGGRDPSAAGRATSISRGVGASLRNPLGLGLGAAGPRAFAIDPTAVRTESWYLVTAVEVGWVGSALFLAAIAGVTRDLARGWRRRVGDAVPATAAWLGALTGGLAIPALFDLTASIPLFILAAMAAVDISRAEPIPEPVAV